MCFIRYPNTSKSFKKTRLCLVFSTYFSVFGYLMKHTFSCLIYYIKNLEVRQTYTETRRIFNSLLGVWNVMKHCVSCLIHITWQVCFVTEILWLHFLVCPKLSSEHFRSWSILNKDHLHWINKTCTVQNAISESCFESHYESEASCVVFLMKISSHSYAKKTNFHTKSFALKFRDSKLICRKNNNNNKKPRL